MRTGAVQALHIYNSTTFRGVGPDSTPAKAASDAYTQVIAVPQIEPATRFEALLRLGGLHFRGALVAAGEAPAPNFEQAYRYFKLAANLAPENELATSTLKEAAAKLTPEQIKAIDDSLAETAAAAPATPAAAAPAAAAEGKAKGEAPAAAPGAAAPGAAAPGAAPGASAPGAAAPAAMRAEGATATAAPAPAPAAAAAAATPAAGEEKKPGFRLPLFGR